MQKRAEVTRRAIVVGAARGFARYGYTANLHLVLEYAGLSRGAMYFHFSSKEELAVAVMRAHRSMVIEGTSRVTRHSSSPMESLILVGQEVARQLVTEPIARGGVRLTMETGALRGMVEQPYREATAAVREILGRAAVRGELVTGLDVDEMARFAVAALTGVQTLSEMMDGRTDLYTRLEYAWRLLLPGMAAPSARERLLAVASTPPQSWVDGLE